MTNLWFLVLFLGIASGQKYNRGIVRPCPNLTPNCIRNFFSENSWCEPTYGDPSQVFYIDYLALPLPHANNTFIWEDAKIYNLGNWRIKEFHVNRNTGNIVFEVEFPSVATESPTSSVIYYFKAREPVMLTDYFSIVYKKMSLTLTVPFDSVNGILWRRRVVFAYFGDDAPYVSSEGLVNSDPDVIYSYNEMLVNLKLGLKEVSPVVGPYYFDLFINNYLCRL